MIGGQNVAHEPLQFDLAGGVRGEPVEGEAPRVGEHRSATDLRGRQGRPGRGRAGGGGDGVPRAPPEPADEPPHAAIINVTAASPADASHLLRIEFPFTRGLAHMMSEAP